MENTNWDDKPLLKSVIVCTNVLKEKRVKYTIFTKRTVSDAQIEGKELK